MKANVPASNIWLSVQIGQLGCVHTSEGAAHPWAQGTVAAVKSLHSSQVHRHLWGFYATFSLLTWETCSLLHPAMCIWPAWEKCRTVSTPLMKMWNRNAINLPWQRRESKAELGIWGSPRPSPGIEPLDWLSFPSHYWVKVVNVLWYLKTVLLKEHWFPTRFFLSTVPKEGQMFMAWICNLQHLLFNPLIKPAYPTVQFLGIIPPLLSEILIWPN